MRWDEFFISFFRIVLNRQLRAVFHDTFIPAEELHVVVPSIIVIVQLEPQPELRIPSQIDILECRAVQPGPVPAVVGVILDYPNRILTGRVLEIGGLQATVWNWSEGTKWS